MKLLLILLISILSNVGYAATVTVGNIPRVNTGGSTPKLEDSPMSSVGNNVGIGSSNPGQALDVNGTVRATAFAVGSGGFTSTGALTGLNQYIGANISIGTSSAPTQALDVKGTVKMTGFALSTSPTNGYVLTSDAGGTGTWQAATGSSQWTTSGSNIFYNSGNVGIGTSTAGSQLTVGSTGQFTVSSGGNVSGGNATFTGTLGVEALGASNNGFTNGGLNGYLGGGNYIFSCNQNNGSATNGCTIKGGTGSGMTNYLKISGGNSTGGSWNITGGNNGATEIATFTDAGNVGIGTTLPIQALDVKGTVRATAFIGNGTSGIGWTVKTGANTACNTTCGTSACAFGLDTALAGSDIVACTDATADTCVCAGP